MARYDRIARIDPPHRDDAFSGWLTLRDLEGREREPELGRRARLRFLALRPVRRLLAHGLDGADADSVRRQVGTVRDQLGQLPQQDPEREVLDRYLEELGGRSASGLVRATMDVGASAEAAGHGYAAEEFYRTALELAEANGLPDLRVAGLRSLGRIQRKRGEWAAAADSLQASADLARELGSAAEWARSMEALSAVHLHAGDADLARSILDRIPVDAPDGEEARVRAIAMAGRCALELAEADPEAALDAGRHALTRLAPSDEVRNGVLLNMASAFRRLGLGTAAASCYEIVMKWAAWPEHRIEAALEHAVVAAEAGDETAFTRRREALLDNMDAADRPLRALVDLGLGRGALLLDAVDVARDHLRDAISAGRDLNNALILQRSEQLLTTLERGPAPSGGTGSASDEAHRIADEVAAIATELVPS